MERRLSPEERDQLLQRPLEAVLATERRTGGVHAVPVWYLYRDGELRVITGRDSVKAANARRTGRATLCVQRADGSGLHYVTGEGSVRFEPCTREERRALWTHYRDEATAAAVAAGDVSGMCVLVITPQRWTAIAE